MKNRKGSIVYLAFFAAFVAMGYFMTQSSGLFAESSVESEYSPTMVVKNKTYLHLGDNFVVVAYYEHAFHEYHQLRYLHQIGSKTTLAEIIDNVMKTHKGFYKYDFLKQVHLIEKELNLYLNDGFLKPSVVSINFQELYKACQGVSCYDGEKRRLQKCPTKK